MYLSKNLLIKFIILSSLLTFFTFSKSVADLVKPNNDVGIEQTWEFAHPKNKNATGPLENFKDMLKGDSYSMLLNHIEHKVKQISVSKNVASFEVTVLDDKKRYYKFKWIVEKYVKDGPLKGCWLTTIVSQPVSLGSSI